MQVDEINRLTWKARIVKAVPRDQSTTARGADRVAPCAEPFTGSAKSPALRPAFDDEVSKSWTSEEIIGPATDLRRITIGLRLVAQTDLPVLIVGETGNCKEAVARSLHTFSSYWHLPFVHLNCQLVRPEDILAELTRGPSEENSRDLASSGRSELPARGRTVFLEGVSNLSPTAQQAILQALQPAEEARQESVLRVPERIRLIASSDVNLMDAVKKGSFSSFLYQHLNTHLIAIPALRDRAEDLPMLVQGFLEQHYARQGQTARPISTEAVELLQLYPWPGNLRELWDVMAKFCQFREAEDLLEPNPRLSPNGASLRRQPEAVPGPADVDECDLMVASLLVTLSLRSRGALAVLR